MRVIGLLVLGMVATMAFVSAPALVPPPRCPLLGGGTPPGETRPLTVLTYNVEGLPWPLALRRQWAFAGIIRRLCDMRRTGTEPHIIVLQEAFTDAAKEIATDAGYPYVVDGPRLPAVVAGSKADAAFVSARHWTSGEGLGKPLDSGLIVASEYPIIAVRRAAFPAFACAGFDCLANKGVVMVTVRDPATELKIQIAATHFNARRKAHVPEVRSDRAYGREVDTLADFLRRNRDPAAPLILAGDFNTSSRRRRRMLFEGLARAMGRADAVPADVVTRCLARDMPCGRGQIGDLMAIRRRNRDWQFYSSGNGARIDVSGVAVPFGREPDGTTLSDHIGYAASYRIKPQTVTSKGEALGRGAIVGGTELKE